MLQLEFHSGSSLVECLAEVFDAAVRIISNGKAAEIDLKDSGLPGPSFALPLMMFLGCDDAVGLDASALRLPTFKAMMQAYGDKNFIPIVKFPASRDFEDATGNVLSVVENVLASQIGEARNVVSGMRYIIGECVDNITQHARSEYGYICAAVNREQKYMDLCIADRGITLLGSYAENGDMDIEGDVEALQAANRGISTKNLPNAENRGYGIITSKKMLTDGLDGLFIMISGGAMIIKSERSNDYFELPEGLRLGGTMVLCRMPYDNKEFNYINFIE